MVLKISLENQFPEASVELFRKQWSLYQKLVQNNYMSHQLITSTLSTQLDLLRRPFSMLDLGCGDAHVFNSIALNYPDAQYTGVDLCEIALSIAKDNLSQKIRHCQFVCSEMQYALHQQINVYDVILLGFSLHHLPTNDKKALLMAAKNRLRTSGSIFVYDIIRYEEEPREDYLQRYSRYINNEWYTLTNDEKQHICQHVETSDFPEPPSFYENLEQEAVFSQVRQLFLDDKHLHALYVLQ